MAKFLFYDDKIINILLKEEKPSGGAAVQAYGWIQGLLASTHDVYLLTNPNGQKQLKDDCSRIKIISDYDPTKGLRWVRWAHYRIPHIYKTLKSVKPDYVYKGIPSWHSFVLGVICYTLKIKFIQRVSNDFLVDKRFFSKYSRLHRLFQDLGFKLSDYILCQNDYQLDIIRRKFPTKAVYKIPNPIVLDKSKIENTDNKRSYIGWLGLFQYQKNLKLLYEIASELTSEKFVIAGREATNVDGETVQYLEKLKRLRNVEFIGFIQREQVLPFLAKSKFLLNTSRYEGFSNTFLEAMATGTPILTTQHVNPDSIISNYKLGFVYSNPTSLKDYCASITPDEYTQLSNNVAKYVYENHDYKILTRSFLSHLVKQQA